jgi:hypothetical protein
MAKRNGFMSLIFNAIKKNRGIMSDLVSSAKAAAASTSVAKEPFHIVLCASKDIKGLLAANMADQFFTPKGIKMTVLLGDDPPKTAGRYGTV